MESKSKKLLQGTIIVLSFMFLSSLLGYTQKFIFARFLEISEIGLFFSVLGFVSFFVFFRDFGLSESLIYFVPRFVIDKAKINFKSTLVFTFFVQLLVGSLVFLGIWFFSDYLAINYFKDPRAKLLLIYLGIFFVLDGLSETIFRTFHGLQKMFYYQAMEFIFQVLSFTFFLLIIFMKKPITLFGIAYIISSVLTGAISFIILIKKFFPDFFSVKTKITKQLRKKLLGYSFPLMTGTFATEVFQQQTIFFLTFFVGLEAVGYYVMALAIARTSIYFYKAMAEPFQPMISEFKRTNKLKEMNYYFNELVTFSYIVAFPLILTLVIFSQEALIVLYGETFAPAGAILKLTSIYCLFYILNVILKRVLSYSGNPEKARNITYFTVVISILFNLIFIPSFGLIGAGISDVITIILALLYTLYINKRVTKINLPTSNLIKIAVSSFIYIAVLFILKRTIVLPLFSKLIIVVFLSGLVYLIAIFFFQLISLKKIDYLLRTATNNRIFLIK